MGKAIRISLAFSILAMSLVTAALGTLSLFGESIIDQGNPPIQNIYRFEGGIVLPGTPVLFLIGAILAMVSVLVIRLKVRNFSNTLRALYFSFLFYAALVAVAAALSAALLACCGHRYA